MVFWAAILGNTAGCLQPPLVSRDGSTEPNKALVRRWIEEGFNQRKLTVVDELFAERFAVNGQVIGRDGLKQSISRHLGGFPDLYVTIDDMVAEREKVGICYTVHGTHGGEFEGIQPTGNSAGFDQFVSNVGRL